MGPFKAYKNKLIEKEYFSCELILMGFNLFFYFSPKKILELRQLLVLMDT